MILNLTHHDAQYKNVGVVRLFATVASTEMSLFYTKEDVTSSEAEKITFEEAKEMFENTRVCVCIVESDAITKCVEMTGYTADDEIIVDGTEYTVAE